MTDDRHEEIAARLREEAAARAPDRLRADVMLQVRAEPRPRRIRSRRTYWRPLGSLAAAACLVAAAVFGVTQLGSGTSAISGGGATRAASASAGAGADDLASVPGPVLSVHAGATNRQPTATKSVLGAIAGRLDDELHFTPEPLQFTLAQRLTLAAPLRRAFAPLEPRQGRGTHTP